MNGGKTTGVRDIVHAAVMAAVNAGNQVPSWALERVGSLNDAALTEVRDLWVQRGGVRYEVEFQLLFSLLRDISYRGRSRAWLRARGRSSQRSKLTDRWALYVRGNRQTGLKSLVSRPTDALLDQSATDIMERDEPDARDSNQI